MKYYFVTVESKKAGTKWNMAISCTPIRWFINNNFHENQLVILNAFEISQEDFELAQKNGL